MDKESVSDRLFIDIIRMLVIRFGYSTLIFWLVLQSGCVIIIWEQVIGDSGVAEWRFLNMERNTVVGIGVQSFEQLRERKALYIDKTGLIREWWEDASSVTLITRPRRFGKTLNMSMLECFFSNRYAGRDDLFEGLSIWEEQSPEGDYRYRALQGTYPVIFISFANVKATKYEKMEYKIRELIFRTYESYRFLLDGDLLSDNEKEYFHSVNVKMSSEVAEGAINMLSDFLYRYFGRKAIIIIDEYDTPMQEAWVHGFWKEAVEFFRSFFGATFKNKDDFEKAVITGITGISKESIFSDLNHLSVITTTSDQYAVYFGFTEKEVFNALDNVGLSESKQGVKNGMMVLPLGHIQIFIIHGPSHHLSKIMVNMKHTGQIQAQTVW